MKSHLSLLVVVESILDDAMHFKAKRTSNLHFCGFGKKHENGKFTKERVRSAYRRGSRIVQYSNIPITIFVNEILIW